MKYIFIQCTPSCAGVRAVGNGVVEGLLFVEDRLETASAKLQNYDGALTAAFGQLMKFSSSVQMAQVTARMQMEPNWQNY